MTVLKAGHPGYCLFLPVLCCCLLLFVCTRVGVQVVPFLFLLLFLLLLLGCYKHVFPLYRPRLQSVMGFESPPRAAHFFFEKSVVLAISWIAHVLFVPHNDSYTSTHTVSGLYYKNACVYYADSGTFEGKPET